MAGRRLIGQRRRQATLPPIGTGSNGLGRCQQETLLIFNFPLKMTRFRPSLIDGRHFVPRELTPPPRPLDSSFHIEIHSKFTGIELNFSQKKKKRSQLIDGGHFVRRC